MRPQILKLLVPISINGVTVDVVQDYKYLGGNLDNKLNWAKNTEAVLPVGCSQFHLLCCCMCWGSKLRAADGNKINRIIKKAGSILGVRLDSLAMVSESRMLGKLHSILDNNAHPLHQVLTSSRSTFSNTLIPPRCNTERHRKYFLPVAIRLHNASTSGRGRDSGDTVPWLFHFNTFFSCTVFMYCAYKVRAYFVAIS